MGFGGVAPYVRRVIVEERHWLTDEEYAAIFGFGQILPGANTINAAVIIGDRFQGALGSAIAVTALLTAPMVVLIMLTALYDRFSSLPDVQAALGGIAAGAAGLVIGTGVKMTVRLRPDMLAALLGAAALLAVVALKISLMVTVLTLAPLGVAAGLLRRGA